MRALVLACASAMVACGGDGGGAGAGFMAATVDGQSWRATGQATRFATADGGAAVLTILGYTPLSAGSKQANRDKPQLEMVFSNEPTVGSYDIATTTFLNVMYMPNSLSIYGASTGSVAVSAVTSHNIEGTFDFVATLAPSGPDSITVTNGSFSAPIGP